MTRWQHTIARPAAHCASWALGLSALLAASSCKFDEVEPEEPINSCVFDSDCESKLCRANRCVAKGGDDGLDVTLEVTPKRMPDGSQPFPIAADPFALKGGKARFDLHLPVEVKVHILDSSSKPPQTQRLEAQISFRPKLDSRFASKATQVTTVGAGAKDTPAELKVLLLSGVNYDVLVQPMDSTRPPHALEYQVDDEQQLDIDYGMIKWESRQFRINPGLPGKLTMRAISKTTGQPISNSAPVGDGTTTMLLFEPGDQAYALEIMSADQPQKTTVKREDCPGQDKIIPTITIDAASLKRDTSTAALLSKDISKDVAKLLTPVVYTGVVQHCDANSPQAKQLTELQVDFKRSNTSYSNASNTFSAAYELSTTAVSPLKNGQFEFCARLPPGEYVVIVTPPLTDACERFAERRTLVAADNANGEISDATLTLRNPVKVSASVVSTDGTPVPNATVELVALGTPGVTLAEDDATVPLYNRSRQATTDASGKFMMFADIGNYDVVIKPPALSNLAWQIAHDVALASRTVAWSNTFRIETPVAVTGTLLYQGDQMVKKEVQQTLAAADVHAYAIVRDENNTSARSVEIGRAQADEMGSVTLLLSPRFADRAW